MRETPQVQGYYQTVRLEKWAPGRGPEDGPPDEVVLLGGWVDAVSGEDVTDPTRIAELEAGAARYRALVAPQEED